MTGIVGRNDYGKSTILEALAIFFESGYVKADNSDMNCFSLVEGAEQFEMACEFYYLNRPYFSKHPVASNSQGVN